MVTSKLEVLVDFGDKPEEKLLSKTLTQLKSQDGVKEAIFKDGAIMVDTSLPSAIIVDIVAKTSGKRTVLQGFGDSEAVSAAAMITSQSCCSSIAGVIRLQQGAGPLVLEGAVDGLRAGGHGLHVRQSGDLSQGCKSLGAHYDPAGSPHGGPTETPNARHAGDLGNITADSTGRATFRIVDHVLKLGDIIGRSIAITENPDDLGKGGNPQSLVDGNSGNTIACGIIARAAAIFQNPKRICQCDGVVVWDERERPLAGRGRRGSGGAGDAGADKKGGCCKV